VKWGSVEDLIRESGGSLLKDIQIIDAPYLYKKGSLSQFHKNMLNEGKKNILFRLVFASEERTLSSSEISEIHAIITKGLKDELNAEIR
jgi:phenylalanyl-tRNA synthetase beta subunit